MADFILRALIAGICIALVAGPLGSFVVWRRMSYFGDTLAHSSLLGIAVGILMDINLQLAVIVSSLVFALVLVLLQTRKTLSTDTLLGILAHSTLAFGLLIRLPLRRSAYRRHIGSLLDHGQHSSDRGTTDPILEQLPDHYRA